MKNIPFRHALAGPQNNQAITPLEERDGPLLLDSKLRSFHATMRGRYPIAIVLGVLCAVIASIIGYSQGRIIYRSAVRLRVVPVLTRVMYNNEEKGALPQYEQFVETQMSLIKSPHVIDAAIGDKAYAGFIDHEDAAAFADSVEIERDNEIVTIYKTAKTADAATAGAQALVDTYCRLYLAEDAQNDSQRLKILRGFQTSMTKELESKKQALLAIGNKFGSPNINSLYEVKLEDFKRMQNALTDLQIKLSLTSGGPKTLQAEDLAGVDQTISLLLQDRSHAQTRLVQQYAMNLGDEHPSVKTTKAEIESIDSRIQARLVSLSDSTEKLGGKGSALTGRPLLSADTIKKQITTLKREYDQCEYDLAELGRTSLQVADIHSSIESLQKKIDETNERIGALSMEGEMGGRISVLADADHSAHPYKDTRKLCGVAGLLGGLTFGFGGVLLPTLMTRRVRSIEEMRIRLTPEQVLGLLPELSGHDFGLDQKAIAAHAVHQIRSMLQIRNREVNPVYAITSPASGSGKTSLAMAMAMSYASAGSRTLLIDGDIVAGGLSRRMEALISDRIGEILRGRGIISPEQLSTATELAKKQGKVLSDVLLQLKFVTPEVLDREIRERHLNSAGILDALQGKPFEECLLITDVPGLSFLPRGGALECDACNVTPRALRRLIGRAKEIFDIVLIDTGPTPASLEASVMSAEADGTIVVVSRGESHRMIESCLLQLEAVGGRLAGAVFNRADGPDIRAHASAGYTGSSARSNRNGGATQVTTSIIPVGIYDPLARAVATSLPERAMSASSL